MMSGKIILMADNMQDFLDVRREFLEQAGYTVITANNPTDAENILERGEPDLAILDIRMVDDDDEQDTSGLDMARKFGSDIPIIMLTGYPTWENVKAALGKDLKGLSPAVDFLSKEEGPNLMIQAVNLTLEHPGFRKNMLSEFQVESSLALHEALQEKGPTEAAEMFRKVLERTERDLLRHRKEISQQSGSDQKIAIWIGLFGIIVIVFGGFLVFLNKTPLAILSGVAAIITEAISALFIARAVKTSSQVDENYKDLQETYKASLLIAYCDTIENKSKAEDVKSTVIKKLCDNWYV